MYWKSPVGPRGLGSDASPLPLSTRIRLPSGANSTPVGYQPVGMKPSTSLRPGVSTSTTATVLLSAFATSSVPPSGDSASAFGVLPTGAFGYSATEICSFAVPDARSTTHTALVFAQATNSRLPSAERSIAFGCPPTSNSAVCFRVTGSKARTFPPPQSET